MAKQVVSGVAAAVIERNLVAEKSASRSRSRSTSVGSSPGSDLPSIAASSPDCSSAVPLGPPGLLLLDQHIEDLPRFNVLSLEQRLTFDSCSNDMRASALGICPPPGLEDLSPSADEAEVDDASAWIVARAAAEMALGTPISEIGNPSLSSLEADMEKFASRIPSRSLQAHALAPACPPPPMQPPALALACLPPPPLRPPALSHPAASPPFSPPERAPILATDAPSPTIMPPPSWSPLTPERSNVLSPPLQPPLLAVHKTAQPVAPPPLHAPVLGLAVLTAVVVPPPAKAPVLRLAEAFPDIDSQALAPPTVGSVGHHNRTCRPCAFLYTKGCGNGKQCEFCHLCGPGEKKRRLKEKRAQSRMA